MRRRRPRAAWLAIAAVLVLAGAPVAGQQPAGAPGGEPDSVVAARQRIETLRAELQRLAASRAGVVKEFETADVELAIRREQLGILQRRAELLQLEEAAEAAQVATLEGLLAGARGDLAVRVKSLYRVGPLSYHRLLLAADSAQDVLVAYQLITYMSDRDRRVVGAVRDTLAGVRRARDTLARTAEALQRLQAETAAITSELDAQQQARRDTLARLDVEAEAQRLAIQEAERTASALQATLAALESTVAADPEGSFVGARGSLPWPVSGTVTTGFGRQRHPVYDTYTVSRGIEISAPEGDPVSAVFAGRVVFADWYSGYGLLVILDHGGGHFTLYGHLRDVAVRVGQALVAGTRIGSVGDTGSLTGANLYFEVRQGTDALDPTRWLSRPR